LLKLRPNDLVVLNNLAYLVAEEMGDPGNAKRYSQQAYNLVIRTGGAVRDVFDTHGWVLTLCGGHDAEQGLQILENLVDNNKDFTKGRLHLARSYVRQTRPMISNAQSQLSIVRQQVQQMEDKHLVIDPELKDGIKRAQDEINRQNAAASAGRARRPGPAVGSYRRRVHRLGDRRRPAHEWEGGHHAPTGGCDRRAPLSP